MSKIVSSAVVAAALALSGLAAPSSAQTPAPAVQTITMKNGASQPVTRTVPGFDVTGTYNYIDTGEPMVVLNADGSGTWRGDTGERTRPITWWIAADATGAPKTQLSPNGQAHTLIVDYGGGDFSGWELAIAKSPRQMWINRERVKAY